MAVVEHRFVLLEITDIDAKAGVGHQDSQLLRQSDIHQHSNSCFYWRPKLQLKSKLHRKQHEFVQLLSKYTEEDLGTMEHSWEVFTCAEIMHLPVLEHMA